MLITCQLLDRAGLFPRVCCPVCHDFAEIDGLRTLIPYGRSRATIKVCCHCFRALRSRYDDSADGMSRNAWARFLWDVKVGLESEP